MILSQAPSPPSLEARTERLPTLDGLRAISITLVMLSHFVSASFFPGGLGVLAFFVISGFLITRLLLAERNATGGTNLKNFYLRRIVRLYPVILVYTAATIGFYIVSGRHQEIELAPVLSALFYFANYLYSEIYAAGKAEGMPFSFFWSLSVEEHFYIVFPILFATVSTRDKLLRIIVIAMCALPLLGRILFVSRLPSVTEPLWHWITYYQTQYRIDSIAFGVLVALTLETPWGQRQVRLLTHPFALALAVAAIVASLLSRDPVFRETWRYTVQATAVSMILCNLLYSEWLPSRAISRALNFAPVVLVGKLSYSLYLWHFFVGLLAAGNIPAGMPHGIVAGLEICASVLVAIASYKLIEMPFLGLRKRLREGGRPKGKIALQMNSAI